MGSGARCRLSANVRGVRRGRVAVLRRLCPRPPSAGAAVVPALREPSILRRCLRVETARLPPLDSARAAFVYDGPARRAIHRLKFSGWRDVAAAMARRDGCRWVRRPRRTWSRGCPSPAAGVPSVGTTRRGRSPSPWPTGSTCRQQDCCAARGHRSPGAALRGPSGGPAMRGVFRADASACRTGSLLVDDVLTTGATRPRRPRPCVPVAPAKSTRWQPRVRCRAAPRCGPPAGRPILGWAHVRVCGCPGMFPVVDASRGRNDPRKATVGG